MLRANKQTNKQTNKNQPIKSYHLATSRNMQSQQKHKMELPTDTFTIAKTS